MDKILCNRKEEQLNITLAEKPQQIFINIPESNSKILCNIQEPKFNFNLSPVNQNIKVTMQGGPWLGHSHPNKEMLDSLKYESTYHSYVINEEYK